MGGQIWKTDHVTNRTKAFVYCILGCGSQVNVRSSIIGSSGSGKEVIHEFLVLIEDAIGQPDISKSVPRFQLVIQEAKVKLDLAFPWNLVNAFPYDY